jgi:hypothetical protein
VSGHCKETLVGILVGSAPRVMHSHRIVRRNRTIKKAPARLTGVPAAQLSEGILFLPEFQNRMFSENKITVSNGLEHEVLRPKNTNNSGGE